MFRRRRAVQNPVVAARMTKFFEQLGNTDDLPPRDVAMLYGEYLWDTGSHSLVDEKKISRSHFSVGLRIGVGERELDGVTKRVALVSDTLLLSHERAAPYHIVGHQHRNLNDYFETHSNTAMNFGFHCPDLDDLGRWLLKAEPLLTSGLAWYLPSYSLSAPTERAPRAVEHVQVIDYLIRDGRAVDASGVEPIKSRVVRPVLQVDIPFIDGVGLGDFSAITVGEFGAYSAFRDFLRERYLEMDDALGSFDSDRKLIALGTEIKDEVRAMSAEMAKVRRKRAVAASGAVIGTVGAVLTAVYGPALASAVAAVGASGGVWGIVNAVTDNSVREFTGNKWYYVWVLARSGDRADF